MERPLSLLRAGSFTNLEELEEEEEMDFPRDDQLAAKILEVRRLSPFFAVFLKGALSVRVFRVQCCLIPFAGIARHLSNVSNKQSPPWTSMLSGVVIQVESIGLFCLSDLLNLQ